MSFRGALATKNLGYIPFMLPRFFVAKAPLNDIFILFT